MANTIITPKVIARTALATLYNNAVLLGLVYRDYDPDFNGKVGDTITVRTPAVFNVNEFDRGTGIVTQDIVEGSFDVKLDTIPDVSFVVTAEDLTLRIDQFGERILTPAMEAVTQYVDGKLADQLISAAESSGGGGVATWNGTAANSAFTGPNGARAKLSRAKLPNTERYAVLSPEATGVALQDQLFVTANQSGSTDGLREASIGRVFGFDTYETQALGGQVKHADGVAFHRSAIAFISRTLAAPLGIASDQVAIENYKGLGLRVVKSYDINHKQDVVSIDMLTGYKALRKQAAVELDFGTGS